MTHHVTHHVTRVPHSRSSLLHAVGRSAGQESLPADTLLPVLVFFHGGAYILGNADSALYGADHLMDKGGIVLVTLNYRLGPLGNVIELRPFFVSSRAPES